MSPQSSTSKSVIEDLGDDGSISDGSSFNLVPGGPEDDGMRSEDGSESSSEGSFDLKPGEIPQTFDEEGEEDATGSDVAENDGAEVDAGIVADHEFIRGQILEGLKRTSTHYNAMLRLRAKVEENRVNLRAILDVLGRRHGRIIQT